MVRLERGIRTKADHKAVATATQHVVDLRLGKVHPLHLHDSQSGCLYKKRQNCLNNDIKKNMTTLSKTTMRESHIHSLLAQSPCESSVICTTKDSSYRVERLIFTQFYSPLIL
jgi:hypothetical protein